MYANVNAGDQKEWQRFNGTYTANYDKNGILRLTRAKFRTGQSGKENDFIIKRKNGRITQVIRRRWTKVGNEKGHWENEEKYVFTYNKKVKLAKARYAMMINANIIGGDNNYYIYNWY